MHLKLNFLKQKETIDVLLEKRIKKIAYEYNLNHKKSHEILETSVSNIQKYDIDKVIDNNKRFFKSLSEDEVVKKHNKGLGLFKSDKYNSLYNKYSDTYLDKSLQNTDSKCSNNENSVKEDIYMTNYTFNIPLLIEIFGDSSHNLQCLKDCARELLILFYNYPDIKINIEINS